jgi:tetratricopeptide (TPR) repeat protein/transcriptional regulator with XRE-family HTH domain
VKAGEVKGWRKLGRDCAVCGLGEGVTEPPVQFASLLRRLRTEAGLTQEELAESARLSARAVSDLERGVVAMPQRDTVRLLADALGLEGLARIEFEAGARGRAGVAGVTAPLRVLPRDVATFTGRGAELQVLHDAAASTADQAGLVAIHAIGGMAGVGKTAFAVHAAHRLAGQFPGGQIFLPLHGHTPGRAPADPGDALASLLLAIGVPAGRVPAELEARAALWRDGVAGRALLLILDDAVGSEQVRPLLPGAGGSLVLVTSRRRLAALEDARAISLDTLPPEDADALLLALTARSGLSRADPAVAEISRLCGYLPLAIGMLARQLHHHPSWTVAGRAAQLAAAVDRLGLLSAENVSVAAAFDLSYADLTDQQQRLFRRLGLHPGADIDAYAAAAVDGTDLAAARRGLAALYDQCLLTEPEPDRYRMHDLIREHARALAGRADPIDDRDQATGRLLDYYQRAAGNADGFIYPNPRPAAARAAGHLPGAPPIANRKQALAWARAERANLLACLDQVTAECQHARVIALTAGIAGLLRLDGPWADGITRHTAAVQAARRLGDLPAQADAIGDLGLLRRRVGDYPGAARDLEEALDICRDLGDRPGQAHVLASLGRLRRMTGDYPGAARDLEEALSIRRDLADRLGQASALGSLGIVRRMTGDYPGAVRHLEEAREIYADVGYRLGQADAFNFLAEVRRLAGDCQGAASDAREALAIYRDLGERLGQANAFLQLGIMRRATRDYPGAARDLGEALSIRRDIGDRAGEVEALNEIGTLNRARGDLAVARAQHEQALDLVREVDSPLDEAGALAGLGRCALDAGHTAEAEGMLHQALVIFQRIGAAEAGEVSAELTALRAAPETTPARP